MQLKKNEIPIENEEFNFQISNSKILVTSDIYDLFLTNEGTVMGNVVIGVPYSYFIIYFKKANFEFINPIIQIGGMPPYPLFLDNKGYLWYLDTISLTKNYQESIKLVNAPCLIKSIDKLFVIGVDNELWDINFNKCGIPSLFLSLYEPKTVKQISCSNNFYFLICEDNSIWSRGENEAGQLGLGNYVKALRPTKVEISEIFVSISCGSNHTLLLNRFNKVFACGSNTKGQIGFKKKIENSPHITQIAKLDYISIISCFECISLCVDLTGDLIAFGELKNAKKYKFKRLNYPPIVFLSSGLCENQIAVQDINGIGYSLNPKNLNKNHKITIENPFKKQNIGSLSLSLDKKDYLVRFYHFLLKF